MSLEIEEEIKFERDLVNMYKNAINIHFNNVISEKDDTGTFLGDTNPFYYNTTITKYLNYLNQKVKSDSVLCTIEHLVFFNIITTNLLIDIVQFFMGIKNYDSLNSEIIEHIRLCKINIDEGFKKLGQFDIKIQDSSIAMKNYCLSVIKESIDFLYKHTHIDIEKSPFKFDFEKLQNNLENSKKSENIHLKQVLISNKNKKYSEKWYALLYWFELMAYGKFPPKDKEGGFIKTEIQDMGKIKCSSTGQNFYKEFINININNEKIIRNRFGENWKEIIKELSENDTEICKYISEKYVN